MKQRRFASIVCLASMLMGLLAADFRVGQAQGVYVPPGYGAQTSTVNPATGYPYNLTGTTPYGAPYANQVYDPRYQAQYGQRFNPAYYSGIYGTATGTSGIMSMIPSILGAAAGAILGGHFGFMGIALGGTLGFFLGRAAGSFLGLGTPIANNYYGYQSAGGLMGYGQGGMTTLLPGIAGAVLGAMAFSGMGAAGLLMGGAAGFFVAQAISKLLFPQATYGGAYYNPYNNAVQYQYRRSDTAPQAPVAETVVTPAPAAVEKASTTAPDLATLQQAWLKAIANYKDALTGNVPDADKDARRQEFVDAQKAYFDAKRAASEEVPDAQ